MKTILIVLIAAAMAGCSALGPRSPSRDAESLVRTLDGVCQIRDMQLTERSVRFSCGNGRW